MRARVKPAELKVRQVERCGATSKRRYRSEAAAKSALTQLLAIAADPSHPGHHRRHERRVHECVLCGGWHLTSQRGGR